MCDTSKGFSSPGGHSHSFFAGFPFEKIMQKIGAHFQHCGTNMAHVGHWVPHNLEERQNEYLIQIPLPGRGKEDIKVSLTGRTLNIKASKPKEAEEESKDEKCNHPFGGFMRHLFSFIEVDMDIPLPENADENNIKSAMSKGLLKIKIGKKPAKNINIDVNGTN